MRKPLGMGQTGYSQPIPKAGIGGSPRFAARTPIGITSDKGSAFLPGAAAEPTSINPQVRREFVQPDIINVCWSRGENHGMALRALLLSRFSPARGFRAAD